MVPDSNLAGHIARGRRLHPLSPVFEIGRSFFSFIVPGLLFFVLAAGDSYEIWYMLLFVPAAIVSLTRYFTLRYALTDEHLVVREGLLFRSVRHIPFGRIQNIDTVQNPLHRLFGVVEVRVETAGGQKPEAVLRVLSLGALETIRRGVFAERSGLDAIIGPLVPGAPGESSAGYEPGIAPTAVPFFRMRPANVAYFGLLSQKGLALLGGLLFLMWEFDLWDRVKARIPVEPEQLSSMLPVWEWVLIGLFVFGLLQLLTILWAFITLYDFNIVRKQNDLRTTCGLWTRQSSTLPRHRIQFLSVREGLALRAFRLLSIKALTAGGDSTDESQVSRKWLIPLVERESLDSIMREIQPGIGFDTCEWSAVHPKARRRMRVKAIFAAAIPAAIVARDAGAWAWLVFALLALAAVLIADKRARRLAFGLGDSAIYVRDGVFTHVRNSVRFSKIQSISLRQSIFDRHHRMATVSVDTAGQKGGDLTLRIPYLDVRVAVRLMRDMRRRAAQTSFRW